MWWISIYTTQVLGQKIIKGGSLSATHAIVVAYLENGRPKLKIIKRRATLKYVSDYMTGSYIAQVLGLL